jgi:hypothetical protein
VSDATGTVDEKLALGSIIAFPPCAPDVFRQLRPQHFTVKANRLIYDVMLDHNKRGLLVDPPLIAAELKSHPEFAGGDVAGYMLELGCCCLDVKPTNWEAVTIAYGSPSAEARATTHYGLSTLTWAALTTLGADVGRGFRSSQDGTPDFFCLLGFQFLLGKAAEEEDPSHEESAGEGGGGADEASTPAYLRENTSRTANRELRRTLVNPGAY